MNRKLICFYGSYAFILLEEQLHLEHLLKQEKEEILISL